MFARTRLRLTVLYVALIALVLGAFSVVFYLLLASPLSPDFELTPDLTNEQAADIAYQATINQIGIAILVADLAVIVLVAGAAWVLATRTLRPIREAHERQRRFVADASHEMRTPLAAIRAVAEGALGDTRPRAGRHETEREALRVVVDETARLTRLTNDLLLLARGDELPPDRIRSPIDLSVVVAETIETFARAHPDLASPETRLGEDLPARADPEEIGRIVANLLDNAYQYGAPATVPRVTTRRLEREVALEVADLGPGIPHEDLERVFRPFARLEQHSAATPGNGLGLAIARSLAIRNGGALSVVSRPGEGATFKLVLPLAR
jgi:OmpR-family two-component system manganese-sensing sensor histidine kinase